MDEQQQNTPEQAPAEQPVQPAATQPTPEEKQGGYGKRPMWQWILLYLVVGGILYYVVYLLFFSGKAGGGY